MSWPDFAMRTATSRMDTLFSPMQRVQAWAGAVEKAGSTSPTDVAKELKSGTFDTVIGEYRLQ